MRNLPTYPTITPYWPDPDALRYAWRLRGDWEGNPNPMPSGGWWSWNKCVYFSKLMSGDGQWAED